MTLAVVGIGPDRATVTLATSPEMATEVAVGEFARLNPGREITAMTIKEGHFGSCSFGYLDASSILATLQVYSGDGNVIVLRGPNTAPKSKGYEVHICTPASAE